MVSRHILESAPPNSACLVRMDRWREDWVASGTDLAVTSSAPSWTRRKGTMTTQTRQSQGGKHAAVGGEHVATPRDVTRYVPRNVQCLLWGRAAGRCQFSGCNKPLWKSTVTQEQVNTAQKAHIYSFSSEGPRGHAVASSSQLNGLGNLMLVCHQCHRKIDGEPDGGRYAAALLQAMKAEHEARVERVTGIAPSRKSHVLLYGANVGDHSSPLNYQEAAAALFPIRYPAADVPIELSTISSSFSDRDTEFWQVEAENLRRKFSHRVRERQAVGDIDHLSVFAVAPQPLLILLGTLLGDIVPVDVYQRHREPTSWNWPSTSTTPAFVVQEPAAATRIPALVLALSATVTQDRIAAVLGRETSIWTVTVPTPHNDVVRAPEQLAHLRSLLRPMLDRIKAEHGQSTLLHVFPVAPLSAAIEFGRVRMPKAEMPWRIYDQVNALGGFVPALDIT